MHRLASPVVLCLLLGSCGGLLPEYKTTVEVDRGATAYLEWTPGIVLNDQTHPPGKLVSVGDVSTDQPLALRFNRKMFEGAMPRTLRFYVLTSDGSLGAFVDCAMNEVVEVVPSNWEEPPDHMADALAGNVVPGMAEELVAMAVGPPAEVMPGTAVGEGQPGAVKILTYSDGLSVAITDGTVSSVSRRLR